MNNRRKFGDFGEEFACRVLEENGYEIIARNFRTKIGEIDIIAASDDTLHFVEVKTRANISCGYPAESVNHEKQRRIKAVSDIFLSGCHHFYSEISYDVFEIEAGLLENCM